MNLSLVLNQFHSTFCKQNPIKLMMESKEVDIVIVGAGIAGLTTSLALHRLGLRSLVLESSDSLRLGGFALTLWTNAWRALDAVGIGDSLRQNSIQMTGFHVGSANSVTSEQPLAIDGKYDNYESRCVKRKELLETLVNALPSGTIRYSSKVVSIEESGHFKLVHLSDGTVLKTKVLIGCDGVNSLVAKWLGLQKPVKAGRSAIRGLAEYHNDMSFASKFYVNFTGGVRFGFLPCDNRTLYWFCTFTPSSSHSYDKDIEQNPMKMKQFVLSKLGNVPPEVSEVVERTDLSKISCAELKLRLPWDLLLGDIVKDNVTVAGDALHPMTPDIGQGGCSALEDSVVLARCLGEALLKRPISSSMKDDQKEKEEEYERIRKGLEKFAKERRWRCFSLISTAYVVGWLQESDGMVMRFLKRKWLSKFVPIAFLRMADFDCGKLLVS